jgi:hypothetical protein
MSKEFQIPTEKLLKGYSVLVEYWSDDAGDTHELLGERELLADRELTKNQRVELDRVDAQVLALAKGIRSQTWDTLMLQKTAELIQELKKNSAHDAA